MPDFEVTIITWTENKTKATLNIEHCRKVAIHLCGGSATLSAILKQTVSRASDLY